MAAAARQALTRTVFLMVGELLQVALWKGAVGTEILSEEISGARGPLVERCWLEKSSLNVLTKGGFEAKLF